MVQRCREGGPVQADVLLWRRKGVRLEPSRQLAQVQGTGLSPPLRHPHQPFTSRCR